MLQPSPLKEISSQDLGGKGLLSKQRENFCFIDYDLFTIALSRVPTVTVTIAISCDQHTSQSWKSSLQVVLNTCFQITLTAQGYQLQQAYQHTLVSLTEQVQISFYRIGANLLFRGETLENEFAKSPLFPKQLLLPSDYSIAPYTI